MITDEMMVNEAPESPLSAREERAELGRRKLMEGLTLSKRDLRRMERLEKRQRQAAQKAEKEAGKGAGGLWQKWAEARAFNASRPGPRGWNRPGGAPASCCTCAASVSAKLRERTKVRVRAPSRARFAVSAATSRWDSRAGFHHTNVCSARGEPSLSQTCTPVSGPRNASASWRGAAVVAERKTTCGSAPR